MLCPKCSKETPDSTAYCAHCGEQLAQSTPPVPPVPHPRTSGLAIASLILGILGGLVITALLGLLFGIIALFQIAGSRGRLRGQGIAIAGTVISGIALLCIPIMAAMVFPVFARARESGRKATCLSNVKNISIALQMYMADNDDRLPAAANWCEDFEPYVKNFDVFVCSAAEDLDCAYAYSSDLSGADLASFYGPATTIAIFESDVGWNASGLPQDLLPAEPRHLGGDNFAFLDGHVQWIARGSPLASNRFTD